MEIEKARWRGWAITGGVTVVLVGGFALLRPGPFEATVSSPAALLRIGALVLVMVLFSQVLKRFLDNTALRSAIIAVPALVILVLIVRPYFTNTKVDEALPTTVAALQNPMEATSTTAAAPTSPAAPVTTAAPAPVATTPPAGPTKLTSGSLDGIDHSASGEAAIYRLGDGTAFVRLEDIDVENGPDYVLYLVPGADKSSPGSGISLGDLKGNQGSQNYELPASVDLNGQHTVLIWCRAFSVPVANATQNPV